jgi:hypothetical protein
LDELVRRVEARNVAGDPNAAIRREHLEEWSSKFFQPPTDDELALYD